MDIDDWLDFFYTLTMGIEFILFHPQRNFRWPSVISLSWCSTLPCNSWRYLCSLCTPSLCSQGSSNCISSLCILTFTILLTSSLWQASYDRMDCVVTLRLLNCFQSLVIVAVGPRAGRPELQGWTLPPPRW